MLELSRQFAKIFVTEANQHQMYGGGRRVRILRANVMATLLYTSIESNSSCYTVVGELELGVAQSLGDTRFKPNFPAQRTRALRAQPDGK